MIKKAEAGEPQSRSAQQAFLTDAPGIHLIAFTIDMADRENWISLLIKEDVVIKKETEHSVCFF